MPFCRRVTSRYSFMIVRTDTDASLGVVVHVRTTNPTFHNRLPPPNTRSPPQSHLQLTRQTTRLKSSPLPDRSMFVGVLCVQRAPSRICNIHGIRVGKRKPPAVSQPAQPRGREEASLEARMTHLRHSSSFHRPPSLRCASVEPDRPGA